MKEFTKLTEDQQKLFLRLERRISQKKSVADILEKYEPKNKGSENEDIKAVFTAFWEDELDSLAGRDDLGRMSAKYTLSALAIKHNNAEALKQILSAVEKIDGLERLILTEIQYKNSELKKEGHSLFSYVNLHKIPYEEELERVNNLSSSVQNKDEMISEANKQFCKAMKIVDITYKRMIELSIPISVEQHNQAAGAGALNAESNTNESNNLTQEQKRRLLSFDLDNAIATQKGVAGILEQYKSENEDSYAEDIEAVLTVFSPSRFTLLGSTVYYGNPKALEDILNATSKIPGLNKKILTNIQYKRKKSKSEITYYTLPEYIYNHRPNMIAVIEEILKELGMPIPQKPQNQAAGHDNSPKSPSFLSQNKGKFAIIGAVALVGTIAAFMSGYPIIGIIVALTATFMLATDKGRGMCDKVGEKLYDALPECFKSQRVAYSGV